MPYLKRLTGILATIAAFAVISSGSATSKVVEANSALATGQQREASAGIQISKNVLNKADTSEAHFAAQLDTIGVNLIPGTEHRKDSHPTAESSTHCKALAYEALMELPPEHRNKLQDLTLFYTEDGRRGLGGTGGIVLRCLNETDSEVIGVLTHEMGHIVDDGYLTGTNSAPASGFKDFSTSVPSDDPSVLYYKISWYSESKARAGGNALDFVSGYASSDPFEDFAETYAFYRLHGEEFRQLIGTSDRLARKYNFMKRIVFGGKEFGNDNNAKKVDAYIRNYDVTVL